MSAPVPRRAHLFPTTHHRSSRAVLAGGMAAVAVASLALFATRATAQEEPTWSQFQGGPGHPGVLADGPPPPYRVAWTLPAPAGDALSGAVVAGDLVVSVGEEAVYGIDLASGAVQWQIPRAGGPLSVPAIGVAGGRRILLYLEGPGPVGAVGPTSPSASPSGGDPTSTTAASPSSAATDEEGDTSTLVAVALGDRTELWRTPLEALSRSGVTIDGANAFVGDEEGTVAAVSLEDGAVTWSQDLDGHVDTPLAVSDGQVYAVARNADTPQVVVAAFDTASGERGWPAVVLQASSTAGSAPTAGGGSVFVGSADRWVRALDAGDGAERWATLALSLFSPATSLAFDGESVFAADISGGLYGLDANDGERRWSFQLNEVVLRSSPVVSGASVLLGLGDGRLVAIDVSSGHLIWESDASPGLVGTIALSTDAVIAVKGGRGAGLIAFEHDPDGALVDVPSPTELDVGATLSRYGLAAVLVFGVALVPGLLARRRFGPAAEGSDEIDDDAPDDDVVDETDRAVGSASDEEEDA
jgi:outer membrane protein assembly factor BamB